MKIRRIAVNAFVILGLCLTMLVPCYAGGMNEHESALYSAASGTFTYEGKTYKAAPEYLAQLQAYLCRDDIDLMADQANAAINEMNASVAEGVAEGYIIPIEDSVPVNPGDTENPGEPESPEPPTDTEELGDLEPPTDTEEPENTENPSDTEESEDPKGSGKKPNKGENGKGGNSSNGNGNDASGSGDNQSGINETEPGAIAENQSTDIDNTASGEGIVTSNGTIYGGVTEREKQKMEKTLSARVPKEDANTEITYNKADNTITLQAADGTIYRLPEDVNTGLYSMWVRIIQGIGITVFVLTLTCGALLLVSGSMKFQKKKPAHSNHKLRRKIRKVSGIVLVAVLVVDILGIGGALWAQMTCFNSSKILDSLSDSGYYHEAYNDMMDQVHDVMKTSGCMENICDDVLTYENFMFATKNQIQLALKGRDSSATYTDIEVKVVEELNNIEYFTPESKELLGEAVLVIYQTSVKNAIGDVAYAVKKVFNAQLQLNGLILLVSAIIAVFCILYEERYIHRGTRKISSACIAAGIIAVVAGMCVLITKPYANLYIAPDYLYLFVVYLLEYSVKVLLFVSMLAIGMGILLRLSANGMKKRLKG